MALVVGQNSWCTVAEADAYLTDRINSESWFALPVTPPTPGEDSKESFLVSAFYWIQSSGIVDIPPTATDSNVKNAQIEGALFLMNYSTELEDRRAAMSTGLVEFKLSKRTEKLDVNNLTLPSHIIGMLPDYSTANEVALLKGEYDE